MEFKDASSTTAESTSSSETNSGRPKPKWKVGPHGLGDPDDLTLRKVETEVMIPIKMREKAKAEKCSEEVRAFSECCKSSSLAMVLTCKDQNETLKTCLTRWYKDDEFKKLCTEEYLKERSEYRRTGIKKKAKKYEA